MAINFDNALGIHAHTLGIRTQRAEIIANNLANSETPGYQARDIDFQTALKNRMNEKQVGFNIARTNARHVDAKMLRQMHPETLYRTPMQPSIDGNTVDEHMEKANFAKNALDFQASFRFINGRFKGLMSAIRGE